MLIKCKCLVYLYVIILNIILFAKKKKKYSTQAHDELIYNLSEIDLFVSFYMRSLTLFNFFYVIFRVGTKPCSWSVHQSQGHVTIFNVYFIVIEMVTNCR